MKILFIGDIVGEPGRRAVRNLIPGIVARYEIDIVIANCENAAGGLGVTREVVEELYKCDIDVLTSGNHIWDKKGVVEFIDEYETLIRPANYPAGSLGRGSVSVRDGSGEAVGVINLQGRIFMKPLDCPFRVAEKEIDGLRSESNIIVVDLHAEATSEKQAMGWFLDGKVSAVLGTHTHVQTADEKILPNGTAYITDVGMTGAMDSILGVRKDIALERFLTMMPNKFEVAKKNIWLQGVVMECDSKGTCLSIERINEKLEK